MSQYDFYAGLEGKSALDLDGELNAKRIDLYSHLVLLHGLDCRHDSALARVALKKHCHRKGGPSRFSLETVSAGHRLMEELGLVGVRGAVAELPPGTTLLELNFTLEKKYVSRDDAVFHPSDNPVRKEWIFRVPMVAPSTWKGCLRAAAVENLVRRPGDAKTKINERLGLIEVFGPEKGEADFEAEGDRRDTLTGYLDKHFRKAEIDLPEYRRQAKERFNTAEGEEDEPRRKGRLRFFPSFFDRVELDVLNPRNRATRTGTKPIVMEVVPAGSRAGFSLLHVPFDLLSGSNGDLPRAARQDWTLIGEALVTMFRYAGFGAKRSSGSGTACERVERFRFESRIDGFHPRVLTRMEDLGSLGEAFAEEG